MRGEEIIFCLYVKQEYCYGPTFFSVPTISPSVSFLHTVSKIGRFDLFTSQKTIVVY